MAGTLLAVDLNQLVWEFLLSGGVFMLLIVLCSLVAAAIVIHRLLSLRREAVMPKELFEEIQEAHGQMEFSEREALRAAAIDSESALGEIAGAAFSEDCEDVEEAMTKTEAVAREEVLRLQSGLSILEDVITIAPLLGLLGTVSGLVSVFAELGVSDSTGADPSVLAGGIARALNTTIAGLAVAVPTVVARTYFHKRIESMAVRMEILFGRAIHERFRRKPVSDAVGTGQGSVEKESVVSERSIESRDPGPAPTEEIPKPARSGIGVPPSSPATLDDLPALPQPTQSQSQIAGSRKIDDPGKDPSATGKKIVSQPIRPSDASSRRSPSEGASE